LRQTAARTAGLLPGGTVFVFLACRAADRLRVRSRLEARKLETYEWLATRIEATERAHISESRGPAAFLGWLVAAADGGGRDHQADQALRDTPHAPKLPGPDAGTSPRIDAVNTVNWLRRSTPGDSRLEPARGARRLYGRGIGWIDAPLQQLAESLGIAYAR
jgi:hypothetical protein